MIPGIDISSYQGTVDWPTLARWGLAQDPNFFVIVKLCEYPDYVSPTFLDQVKGAEAAGIQNIGYYMYVHPSKGSGAAHGDFFFKCLNQVGGAVKNCFYALDFEDNTGIAADADLDAFAVDLDQRIAWPAGLHPLMYSASFYTVPHNLNKDSRLAQMGIWWAAPDVATIPATPEPWASAGKSILIWQYSWHGTVPGIQGQVDLDWLNGDISALRSFQEGYQPDPLARIIAAGTPDVAVNPTSESVLDANATFIQIVTDIEKARGMVQRGTPLDTLLATVQADAADGAKITWGH